MFYSSIENPSTRKIAMKALVACCKKSSIEFNSIDACKQLWEILLTNFEYVLRTFPEPGEMSMLSFLDAEQIKLLLQKAIHLVNGLNFGVFFLMLQDNLKYRVRGCRVIALWGKRLRNLNSQYNNWLQDQVYALIDSTLQVPITASNMSLKDLCVCSSIHNKLNTGSLPIELQVSLMCLS